MEGLGALESRRGLVTGLISSNRQTTVPKIEPLSCRGLVILGDVCAARSLELDGSRQDICSSYPPGVVHKVDSLSRGHGPGGCTAATTPSPNTIRKRDLFIQPFRARIGGR
ncbi:unnamed protein product [Pleuronectes platessa]|uniref:Uncharacterized protein n=1 Tax=Pleuronectes platessa TaxID=8262 RepID=A0A9N7YH15_PLEPL|nr:unnamed protein product [Pleuronectes platessa]